MQRISIHALLAESDLAVSAALQLIPLISIHALLAESDYLGAGESCDVRAFLSTLSLRRATNSGAYHVKRDKISIHALLAESDRQ